MGGGGAEKHVQRIANEIQHQGQRVTVAVARSGGSYEKELSKDVERLVLSDGWLNSSTWRLMRSVRPLRKYIRHNEPDVVCSVMDHVNVRLMRAVQPLATPPLTVLSIQNNPVARFGSSAHWRNRLLFWRMQRQYPRADAIVALSQGVADHVVEMDLADREHVSVIYNAGVDDELFRAREKPLPVSRPRTPLILACGSLTRQKGYPYLLDAFRDVRNRTDAELWILGEGDKREEIDHRIRALELDDDVELLGFRENPFKFMSAADLFVLPSLWEGFGNVIVEAMACGTPVVATDCPYGPGEIITHEQSGLLVPPADADALSQAMLRVLHDEPLSKTLAENGRERAEDFHVSTIADQYLDLFQRVVSGFNNTNPDTSEKEVRRL
nr:glycosyltransferase [Salinibacter ruber]